MSNNFYQLQQTCVTLSLSLWYDVYRSTNFTVIMATSNPSQDLFLKSPWLSYIEVFTIFKDGDEFFVCHMHFRDVKTGVNAPGRCVRNRKRSDPELSRYLKIVKLWLSEIIWKWNCPTDVENVWVISKQINTFHDNYLPVFSYERGFWNQTIRLL